MFIFEQIGPEDTLSVRQRTLWPDRRLDEVRLSEDVYGLHLGALRPVLNNSEIVGVASFFLDGDAARLRKMAILPEVQGQGCGRGLMDEAVTVLTAKGVTRIWCDVRVSAEGFYKNLDFEIENEVFLKSGVAYKKAQKILL